MNKESKYINHKSNDAFNDSNVSIVRKIATSNGYKIVLTELNELEQKFKSQNLFVVVLGLFKRGKSSIINALIDNNLAPVAITPLTSVITRFQYGTSTKAEVIFDDDNFKTIDIAEIADFVSEDLNPENIKRVRQVNIWAPSELLKKIVLIDTPGLGSLNEHNSQTTLSFIPKIDVGLFVLSADLPMSLADGDFLKNISTKIPKLIYLLNKSDLLSTKELEQLMDYNVKTIAKHTGKNSSDIPLLPISAKQYLQENSQLLKIQSGIATIKEKIQKLSEKQNADLIGESVNNRFRQMLNQTMQLLQMQLVTYNSPIADIETQAEHLKKSLSIIQKSQDDFNNLVKNRIRLIQKDIEQQINLKTTEILDFRKARFLNMEVLESILKTSEPAELIRGINTQITEDYWNLHHQIENDVKQRFSNMMLEFGNQSQNFLNELSKQLESKFGIKIELLIDKFDLKAYSPFYVAEISTGKIFTTKFKLLRIILPAKVSNKILAKNFLRELNLVNVRNSAGMMYDITYRMNESLRKFSYDLNLKATCVINELFDILDKIKTEKMNKEASAEDKISKLRLQLLQLENLIQCHN